MNDEYIGAAEAAKILECSRQAVYNMVDNSILIPVIRPGCQYIFKREDILKVKKLRLERNETGVVPSRIKKGSKVRFYKDNKKLEHIEGIVLQGHKIVSGNEEIIVQFNNGKTEHIKAKDLVKLKSRTRVKFSVSIIDDKQ